jgi:hypothetical protein
MVESNRDRRMDAERSKRGQEAEAKRQQELIH